MADRSKREWALRDEVADGIGRGRHRNRLKALADKARRREDGDVVRDAVDVAGNAADETRDESDRTAR